MSTLYSPSVFNAKRLSDKGYLFLRAGRCVWEPLCEAYTAFALERTPSFAGCGGSTNALGRRVPCVGVRFTSMAKRGVQASVPYWQCATRVRSGETHLGSFGLFHWGRIAGDRVFAAVIDPQVSTVPKLLVRTDVARQRWVILATELKHASRALLDAGRETASLDKL